MVYGYDWDRNEASSTAGFHQPGFTFKINSVDYLKVFSDCRCRTILRGELLSGSMNGGDFIAIPTGSGPFVQQILGILGDDRNAILHHIDAGDETDNWTVFVRGRPLFRDVHVPGIAGSCDTAAAIYLINTHRVAKEPLGLAKASRNESSHPLWDWELDGLHQAGERRRTGCGGGVVPPVDTIENDL
jgi:hypothetical protein